MKKCIFFVIILLASIAWRNADDVWGFFGHRLINRMAIFTLPSEMISLFKDNIEFVTEHAVDPDKRRYATKHEAVRHYIDIDHWGEYPFYNVPRDFNTALMKYADVVYAHKGDTIYFKPDWDPNNDLFSFNVEGDLAQKRVSVEASFYRDFFSDYIRPQYYEDTWTVDVEQLNDLLSIQLPLKGSVNFVDHFSEYGILPYSLLMQYNMVVQAMKDGDKNRILDLSTDLGHYVGDAHVPLHTTTNYNGQETDQVGIHGFWESRLPELYAMTEYDFFVGKAEKIEDIPGYFWKMVLDSHELLDSVLLIEKRVHHHMPSDLITCFEDRLERSVPVQCEEFCREYHDNMDGMVESRLRSSIVALGSVWYTAWIEAGRPDLSNLKEIADEEAQERYKELDALYKAGEAKGRKHE